MGDPDPSVAQIPNICLRRPNAVENSKSCSRSPEVRKPLRRDYSAQTNPLAAEAKWRIIMAE